MTALQDRLTQVRHKIHDLACACQRDPRDIRLLAVSKTRPAEEIRQLLACGQTDFGENYLQDALPKIQALAEYNPCWHFIGRIQSNKTRDIAHYFDWVHALSSAKHAQRLNNQRPEKRPPLNVCIQVNISGEANKSGIQETLLSTLAEHIQQLPRLRLRGLMTMTPAQSDEREQRAIFRRLRELSAQLQAQGFALDTLSMGMSNDMRAAICEGATIVRIGTAIFGPRHYS